MSFYQQASEFGQRFFGLSTVLKYGFNYSPMFRRTTGKLIHVSHDLHEIILKIPISYRNKNYVGTIFGGSMFSAVDPIPMVQLINILGKDYTIWDKSAEIFFKRPGNQNLYAKFIFTRDEIETIKERIKKENEIEIIIETNLTDKLEENIFCNIKKKIYIADKSFYKKKMETRKLNLK